MPRILVVAPHSHCHARDSRDCDKVAAQVAEVTKEYVVATHLADRPRLYGDYNRGATYFTQWRDRLRDMVADLAPDFMLEVHSFPADTPDWVATDLVLFASPWNAPWIGALARDISAADPRLDVRIATAGPANSIMHEFAPRLPHVLAEFNEDGRNLEAAARGLICAIKREPWAVAAKMSPWRCVVAGWSHHPFVTEVLLVALIVVVLLLVWAAAGDAKKKA